MKFILFCTTILISSTITFSQKQLYRVAIGFYNVENLYDTLDTDNTNDTEFTPLGSNNWNSPKYWEKMDRLGEVIEQMGTDGTPDGIACLGLAEIENRSVLEDLVKNKRIQKRHYEIIHHDGPDRRGVDVAFLYNPKYFSPTGYSSYTLKIPERDDFFTRDQLLVSGNLMGEKVHFVICHWPSRRGGEKRSAPLRMAAASLARHIVDSIQTADGMNAKVIVMGDLNDDPVNKSVVKNLRSKSVLNEVTPQDMFNPFYDLYNKGIGSLAWQDVWNLFDQIILSPGYTVNVPANSWHFSKARVFNKPFLAQPDGRFKGYPFRSYAGGQYQGGYSDHFPTYIFLEKETE